ARERQAIVNVAVAIVVLPVADLGIARELRLLCVVAVVTWRSGTERIAVLVAVDILRGCIAANDIARALCARRLTVHRIPRRWAGRHARLALVILIAVLDPIAKQPVGAVRVDVAWLRRCTAAPVR